MTSLPNRRPQIGRPKNTIAKVGFARDCDRNLLRFALTYPAGDGSIVIFRSMPANSWRVRCLSASSNQ